MRPVTRTGQPKGTGPKIDYRQRFNKPAKPKGTPPVKTSLKGQHLASLRRLVGSKDWELTSRTINDPTNGRATIELSLLTDDSRTFRAIGEHDEARHAEAIAAGRILVQLRSSGIITSLNPKPLWVG